MQKEGFIIARIKRKKRSWLVEEGLPFLRSFLIVLKKERIPELFMIVLVIILLGATCFMTTEYSFRSGSPLNSLDARDYPFFGEIALVEVGVLSASAVAETDCKLMVIKKEDFDRLCDAECDIGYRLIRNTSEVICTMLRKSNNDVIKLATALSIAMNR